MILFLTKLSFFIDAGLFDLIFDDFWQGLRTFFLRVFGPILRVFGPDSTYPSRPVQKGLEGGSLVGVLGLGYPGDS